MPETVTETEAAAFVERHQRGLWRYLRALGAGPAQAEDLLQDSLLVALDRFDIGGSGDGEAAAFLRRTARYLWLRNRRDHRRREQRTADALEARWNLRADDDDGSRWIEALRGCVAQLEGRGREVVRRFYEEGQARADVARDLGMKENGVKTLLQRVRASLRACVERNLKMEERR
ncbi:MAG: sigma-70 family RNA polymerase sigma factor [Planctomycetes bacterium]|nr:sigma-70 family RNA polymerase sigma factor [Planctomycetota bacterium]